MISDWMKAAANSVKSVATTMGFDDCEVGPSDNDVPSGMGGAFIPLVGQQACVQLGVMALPDGLEALARVVLQMEDDEEVDHECVTDAVGELANCIVGQIKVAMRKHDASLKIGLPVYIEGKVEDIGGAEHKTLRAQLNGVAVAILVVAKDA